MQLSCHALLLLVSSLLISCIHSQPNACNGTFSFIGATTMAIGNITHCKKLPTLGFELGWNYHNTSAATGNATLDVVFSAIPPTKRGWVAWGVNPGHRPQMVGTRALIAFVTPNGGPAVVRTFNLTAETKSGCHLVAKDLELAVVNSRAYYSGETGAITVAATLRLPESMYNVSKLHHLWQVGPFVVAGEVPVMHGKRLENFDSKETLNLTSGHSVWSRHEQLRTAHGVMGIIGWGVLLPVGVILVRNFKGSPFHLSRWFLAHVGVQIMGFTIGTIAWGIGLSMVPHSEEHYRTFMAHRIIGFLIFFLACLQIVALWLKPNKEDKYRKYWCIYHHFIGYCLIALTITNIFKGLAILRPPSRWKWTYIGILTTLSSMAFGLEIVTWFKFCMSSKIKDDKAIAPTK